MHRAERSEELGEDGGGAAGVAAGVRVREVADERLGEHGRRLVGVGGAAVQVEVVDGVGAADADDDVVGVGRAEARAAAPTTTTAVRPASAWRHSDSATGRTTPPVLPDPAGPTTSMDVPSRSVPRPRPAPR